MSILLRALLSIGIVTACATTPKPEGAKLSASEQAAVDRQAQGKSAESAGREFARKKAEYRQTAEDEINQLESQIAAFKAQKVVDKDARLWHQEAVARLEARLTNAQEKLALLEDADYEDWPSYQSDVEMAIATTRAEVNASTASQAH